MINAAIVYLSKNPEFKKKKQSHKLFREILAPELVQSLDRRSNGYYPMSRPGRRPINFDVILKEKHFNVSKHPLGNTV